MLLIVSTETYWANRYLRKNFWRGTKLVYYSRHVHLKSALTLDGGKVVQSFWVTAAQWLDRSVQPSKATGLRPFGSPFNTSPSPLALASMCKRCGLAGLAKANTRSICETVNGLLERLLAQMSQPFSKQFRCLKLGLCGICDHYYYY